MDVRTLRYFVAVAVERSFSRAAERLHIAQPPLSQQIQRLECELGVTLIDRTTRPIRLTNEGQVLLEHAREVISAFDDVGNQIARAHSGEIGKLSIGCVPSTLFEMIPKILSDYRSVYPEVTVSVHSMDTTPLIERLIAGDLDAGFLRCDPHATGLAARRLHAERHVVALPENHPLARAERVALADLAEEQFVVFPRSAAPQNFDLLTTASTNAGFSPDIVVEQGGFDAQVGYVACGIGVAIVPESLSRTLHLPGVVYRQLTDEMPTIPTVIAWPERQENPLVRRLLEVAQRQYGRHQEETCCADHDAGITSVSH